MARILLLKPSRRRDGHPEKLPGFASSLMFGSRKAAHVQ